MVTSIGAAFYNGGPQALSRGNLEVVAGALLQALRMVELAPEKNSRLITWVQVSIY